MEETEKVSVYAEDDRVAAREELEKVQKAFRDVVEGQDKELAEEVQRRIGQRIRELEQGVKAMEELANGQSRDGLIHLSPILTARQSVRRQHDRRAPSTSSASHYVAGASNSTSVPRHAPEPIQQQSVHVIPRPQGLDNIALSVEEIDELFTM